MRLAVGLVALLLAVGSATAQTREACQSVLEPVRDATRRMSNTLAAVEKFDLPGLPGVTELSPEMLPYLERGVGAQQNVAGPLRAYVTALEDLTRELRRCAR